LAPYALIISDCSGEKLLKSVNGNQNVLQKQKWHSFVGTRCSILLYVIEIEEIQEHHEITVGIEYSVVGH